MSSSGIKKPDTTTPNSSADEWTETIGEDAERDLIEQKGYGSWSNSPSAKNWIPFHQPSCSGTQRRWICDKKTMDCGGRSMVRFGGVVNGCKFFCCSSLVDLACRSTFFEIPRRHSPPNSDPKLHRASPSRGRTIFLRACPNLIHHSPY
jgi:hypothetical protein